MSSVDHQSGDAFIRLPPTVLDAFVPGYSFLATFLLEFGIDVSLFVSCFALGAAAWTAFRFAVIPFCDVVVSALSSSIIVQDYDPIYTHVLNWASVKKSLQHIRALRAHSPGQYYEDFGDATEDDSQQLLMQESLSEDAIFNFNDWSARAPPKFQPHSSSGYFFHNGYLFRLYRNRERIGGDQGLVYNREYLLITVIWLSPTPIKSLIAEAREFHLSRQTSTTSIKRPTPKAQRSGRREAWCTIAVRPSRSMATVVLDSEQKARILRDFNDFLHPRTARWYSNRGIPYRRGYLLHGPPGTGKTSLSFALAGVFGLDIYCLALSEVTLTEEDLILLFNSLPKRCILLLEDIDSAGVGMIQDGVSNKKLKSKKKTSKKRLKRHNDKDDGKKKGVLKKGKGKATDTLTHVAGPVLRNSITLSGLLNAIDGVASQEGRLLIMTTNHIHRISEALVRPGRVDLSIQFDLANKQQIKDLFLRMYCADSIKMARLPTKISQILPDFHDMEGLKHHQSHPQSHIDIQSGSPVPVDSIATPEDGEATATTKLLLHDESVQELQVGDSSSNSDSDRDAISILADKFADTIPELVFSPAEIQGFLLVRKKSPAQAVDDVAAWIDEQMKKKEAKARQAEAAAAPTGQGREHVKGPLSKSKSKGKSQAQKRQNGEVPGSPETSQMPNGLKDDDHDDANTISNVDGVEHGQEEPTSHIAEGALIQEKGNKTKASKPGLGSETGNDGSKADTVTVTNGEAKCAAMTKDQETDPSDSSDCDDNDDDDGSDEDDYDDDGASSESSSTVGTSRSVHDQRFDWETTTTEQEGSSGDSDGYYF